MTNPIYQQGYEAFENGSQQEDNPYKEGTENHSQWDDGWFQGYLDSMS